MPTSRRRLREAAEEVALDAEAAQVRVVGLLDRFWIPVSRDCDRHTRHRRRARTPGPDRPPEEVARIVEPPVERFLPGAPVQIVERTIRDWPLRYGAYDLDGLSVWGATART